MCSKTITITILRQWSKAAPIFKRLRMSALMRLVGAIVGMTFATKVLMELVCNLRRPRAELYRQNHKVDVSKEAVKVLFNSNKCSLKIPDTALVLSNSLATIVTTLTVFRLSMVCTHAAFSYWASNSKGLIKSMLWKKQTLIYSRIKKCRLMTQLTWFRKKTFGSSETCLNLIECLMLEKSFKSRSRPQPELKPFKNLSSWHRSLSE